MYLEQQLENAGVADAITVRPSQYFDIKPRVDSPTKALMFAVLVDGVHCARKVPHGRYAQEIREAKIWLKSDSVDFVFDFCTLCHVFDLDPVQVRALVRDTTRKLPVFYHLSGKVRRHQAEIKAKYRNPV